VATPLSLSSPSLPASRLLPPRSGLERSDFVRWHFSDIPRCLTSVRNALKTGNAANAIGGTKYSARHRSAQAIIIGR
jgi:hypothetical protein